VTGLILPRWPTKSVRPGDRWDESVEWVQAIGDWKVLWKGQLHWTMIGLDHRDETSCLHMNYQANLIPHLWDTPGWAHGAVRDPHFVGTVSGDACFDSNKRQLFANEMNQEGALRVAISNLYKIPVELRVGRTPRQRWGRPADAQAGVLIIQFKEKY